MGNVYRKLLFLFALLALQQVTRAQYNCGTDEIHRKLLEQNPEYKKAVELQRTKWQQYNKAKASGLARPLVAQGEILEIPIVIHVVHSGQPYGTSGNPSYDQLVNMIAKLNAIFSGNYIDHIVNTTGSASIPIRFKFAQRTPICQSTYGVNYVDGSILPEYSQYGVYYNGDKHGPYDAEVKALSRWPYESYLNIWMVTKINGSVNGGGVAGYATLPLVYSTETDGVVVTDTSVYILAHEVGHYLALYHTFEGSQDGICPPNNDCTIDGDQVCDTEPHYQLGCNTTGINACTNQPWGLVGRNFMNYYGCQGIFTAGQKDRMLYALKELRGTLLTSLGGLPNQISPTFYANPVASCLPAGIVHSGYDMGPFTVKLADMLVNTRGNYGDNNQYYVDHTPPLNCVQSQPVAHLDKGGTYTLTVTTELSPQKVRGWIDYNNDGIFQTTERIISSNGTKESETHTSSFTVPTAGVATCASLRMRIMADAAEESAPQPCSTLMYGQAEDFLVIIKEPASASPSLTIAANTGNQICFGSNVTFTATPINGVSVPEYQWQKNGTIVGNTEGTYSDNQLQDEDVITCAIINSQGGPCPAYQRIASNAITMSVISPPSLNIATEATGNKVCQGTNVVFKALPILGSGGTNPRYQWKKNGINIGTNSDTCSSNSLANGDVITCEMTVVETCPGAQTVVSNPITMEVSIPPGDVIVTPPPVAACIPQGQNSNVGPMTGAEISNVKLSDLNYYTSESINYKDYTLPTPPTCFPVVAHLKSGDTYSISATTGYTLVNVRGWIDFNNDGVFQATELILTSNGTTSFQTHTSSFTVPKDAITRCTPLRMRITSGMVNGNPTPPPPEPCSLLGYGMAVDFTVTISDTDILVPAVYVTKSRSYICEGENVTFTATPENGGNNPTYYWRLNGLHVGTNSNTYSSSTLKGENEVICIMTSSELSTCNPVATSGSVFMSVLPIVTPTISIRSDISGPICAGTNVSFWATYTHSGLPSFEWKVNGKRVGNSYNAYYFTSTLKNGDVVTCDLYSSQPCATIRRVESNAIVMDVLGPLPSVTICANTNGTFTATAANFNPNPTYQWKLNGTNVGTNNSIYTTNALGDGTLTCVITGSTDCATLMTATSNGISISSGTAVKPEIYVYTYSNTICRGASVTFTAGPVNGGINPKYQWKVGNVLVGTNSPTYTTSNLTNGSVVTCTLTSDVSCTNSITVTSEPITISISSPPLSTVVASGPTTFCAGKNVLLKAPVAPDYTYQWRMEGINIGNATGSTYTATTAGAYSVLVTNFDGCTSTSQTINVTINPVPLATVAAASALTFCAGKNVQLKAIAGTGYTYQWKRGATDIAGANLSTYTAVTTGIYTVTVTNASGCSAISAGLNVVVKPLPSATITPTGPTTFCSNKNVLLRANTGTNYTYKWIRGAVAIAGATQPNYTANLPGLYTVVVTNSSGCSVTSSPVAIVVNPMPVATITNSTPLTFCSGQQVLLRANTGTNYTYQWRKAGINITGATQVNYPATSSGVYSVIVTNASGCAVTSAGVTVTVNSAPLANLVAASSTTFCAGKNVLLKAITGAGYTYQWKKNGIIIPNEAGSNYSAATTGSYSVVVSNTSGCSTSSVTIPVSVIPAPLATVAVAGPLTFCEGQGVLLKAITGAGYTYQWKKNGTNIPAQAQSNFIATTAGVYTVAVTNANGCTTLSTDITVNVIPAPSSIITASGPLTFPQGSNVVLSVSSEAGNVYQWKRDGVTITGETTNSYTASTSGSYTVMITNSSGCVTTSQIEVVTVTQSRPVTKTLNQGDRISVYPNPIYRNDVLNIDWNIHAGDKGVRVIVYDATGRIISTQMLAAYDKTIKLRGASGVYFVEVRWGENKRNVFKVLKVE